MPLTLEVRVNVNGAVITAAIPSRKLLSDFLRDEAGLTGVDHFRDEM